MGESCHVTDDHSRRKAQIWLQIPGMWRCLLGAPSHPLPDQLAACGVCGAQTLMCMRQEDVSCCSAPGGQLSLEVPWALRCQGQDC